MFFFVLIIINTLLVVFIAKYNTMGKIIKENGKVWFEEIQDVLGRHRKLIYLGEDDTSKKDKKKRMAK